MSASTKKMRERFWLDRFIELSGLQVSVDDDRADREGPDFLVRYEDRLVGIEITELQIDRDRRQSKGSELQKELSLQQAVVYRAQQLYFAGNRSQPINAHVYFSRTQSLLSVHRGDLAEELAQALRQISIGALEQRRLDARTIPSVPKPIAFVYVTGLPANITPRWQVVSPGWSKIFEASDIESLLIEKNALVDEYRKTVADNWLLVVSDGRKPPGMFRAPEQDDIELPASEFDRTFFLCEPDRLFIEWPARSSGRITRQ